MALHVGLGWGMAVDAGIGVDEMGCAYPPAALDQPAKELHPGPGLMYESRSRSRDQLRGPDGRDSLVPPFWCRISNLQHSRNRSPYFQRSKLRPRPGRLPNRNRFSPRHRF